MANKEGSVAALLAALKAASSNNSKQHGVAADSCNGSSAPAEAAAAQLAAQLSCLRTLRLLMQLPNCRASFLSGGGAEQLQQLMRQCNSSMQSTQQEQQQQCCQLGAAVAALAEAASWQDEEGKCRWGCEAFMQRTTSSWVHGLARVLQHQKWLVMHYIRTPVMACNALHGGGQLL